jgi:hypothetical protein
MGWFAYAVSPCGRIEVRIHTYLVGPKSYSAFFADGRWYSTSQNPELAVHQVIQQAKHELKKIGAYFKKLPT